MIVLRVLAAFAAVLVLVVSPLILDPDGHGLPGRTALIGLLGMGLMACSFLYMACVAQRMRRRIGERIVAGILLMAPAAGGAVILGSDADALVMTAAGLLMIITGILLMAVMFPNALHDPERRLRLRRRIRRTPPTAPASADAQPQTGGR